MIELYRLRQNTRQINYKNNWWVHTRTKTLIQELNLRMRCSYKGSSHEQKKKYTALDDSAYLYLQRVGSWFPALHDGTHRMGGRSIGSCVCFTLVTASPLRDSGRSQAFTDGNPYPPPPPGIFYFSRSSTLSSRNNQMEKLNRIQ
ncbi:hypothetical protein SK128_026225 [Halocaridina rubra]|uniref:Uncharacterized protein n=1 Tax=Halocaridina rubra TaxID=373956 RepID=A0AAN8ZWV7_HALRR